MDKCIWTNKNYCSNNENNIIPDNTKGSEEVKQDKGIELGWLWLAVKI